MTTLPRQDTHPPTPLQTIASEMLQAALGGALRRGPQPLAPVLAVEVPAAWIDYVEEACLLRAPEYERLVLREPPDRRDAEATTEFLAAIAEGVPAIALVTRLALLPPALAAVVDSRHVVCAPDGALLRRVVRRLAGTDPGRLEPGLGADALPEAIAACFRPGSKGRAIVARLRALAGESARSDPPPAAAADAGPRIEDLHGYGAARDWGLLLRDEIAALRRGELSFRELSQPAAVLAGPPGSGKTSFGRALARSCGIAFVESSVASWFEHGSGYLDSVVKAASASMTEARAAAEAGCGAALLLWDEIDALPDRAEMTARGREWWATVVGHVLQITALGSPTREGVVLLGATNHAERLDPALLRPGRFERVIRIPLPDARAIPGILATHATELAPEDLAGLAPLLVGRSGAEIAALVRVARAAARRAGEALATRHLAEAAVPDDGLDPARRRAVAVHEAGHAVVAAALGLPLELVSIVPAGDAGGAMTGRLPSPTPTRGQLEDLVAVALAGRAADEIWCGEPTAGASSDLELATRILADLHASYGLGETLVAVAPDAARQQLVQDSRLRTTVEVDLKRLYARALSILSANHAGHRRLVAALLRRRLLTGPAALRAIGDLQRPPDAA